MRARLLYPKLERMCAKDFKFLSLSAPNLVPSRLQILRVLHLPAEIHGARCPGRYGCRTSKTLSSEKLNAYALRYIQVTYYMHLVGKEDDSIIDIPTELDWLPMLEQR